MKQAWSIGRIAGIPIRVHWSFFLILLWSGYTGYTGGGGSYIPVSVTLTLLTFLCVLLHELGHAVTAQAFGVRTRSILLLPIGGVALLERVPEQPGREFLVAAAGPAVNLVILGFLYGVFGWPDASVWWKEFGVVNHVAGMLMYMNIAMIAFNLLPAFPMDGGRMLRALLAVWLPYHKATAVASRVGQGFAVLLFTAGIFLNPFLCLIGVFVYAGARAENRQVAVAGRFQGLRAADVMTAPCAYLAPGDPLRRCAEVAAETGQRDFVVVADGRPVGVVSAMDWLMHSADGEAGTDVGMIMTRPVVLLDADLPVAEVFRVVMAGRQDVYPVVADGRPIGMLTRAQVRLIMRDALDVPQSSRKRRSRMVMDVG